jgi:hypothetical protein
MRNTADVTGGKPIAVLLQSISGVSAINSLVAFYDIHGEKKEVLFFYFTMTQLNICPRRRGFKPSLAHYWSEAFLEVSDQFYPSILL